MKIYTKTGDGGMTSLWGHGDIKRVPKDHLRVEAYGTIDEANALIGVARSFLEQDAQTLDGMLNQIQNTLFALGADLSNVSPDRENRLEAVQIETIEHWIDDLEEHLVPLQQFILPGGHPSAAFLHQARTVVRRAERRLVPLVNADGSYALHLQYLNRLSDFLFVAARDANRAHHVRDIIAEF
ncbi:cob(I)yrinic acid a,c-diamide adenosyltransferase [Sulfobacillus thermosulfidooxidans]|uniref:Corrinoid adenosyltransferase n=1 Tax=Sulfobacillus thermosulfidooxidans (strain DSM 9293 / VKM B-1269 / AT-1) TaxID=929705 RepID=A0A1W1W7P7_SULTA|nr:cob(I)yrinic acid a,c-diamide adenosyltransferase [Sulfobacillus thermosulfidooxidans]OLZ10565.1 ATP:cob(I)alamin adenosyltransferase [Sulfobacillus thermosulfidooxidans]OLZ16802.1 ATP:cob(I)alamin adenosyltransferase [Sulfobacillus thermosulfidooxidans]OLZ22242.1 ATP:cob(I)alamin adenosyltransferase [Sulfobacillus thermosulfidooxidans]SMC02298.1 cob(I)alamin adenosyltransferase [Sulfobacillus thermosulfidooxidans DSM 9293]